MKLGSHGNPLTVSAATASTSSASTMAAFSSTHKTESHYLLDAGALHHDEGKGNTPLGSRLAPSRDDELDIPVLGPSEPAANDPEKPVRQIRKWKVKDHVSITR